jgi:hypothetical protein
VQQLKKTLAAERKRNEEIEEEKLLIRQEKLEPKRLELLCKISDDKKNLKEGND